VSCSFGEKLRVTVFGQSHSAAIGVVIEGLPAGEAVDMERVQAMMARRAPGGSDVATPRKEADVPRVLSGLVDGMTCGAPLCAVIENTNTRSGDYAGLANTPRPGHADYPAGVKYGGHNDLAGGGHFSGRLTAPLCFAGAVCLQILERRGVNVAARAQRIAGIQDAYCDPAETDLSAWGAGGIPTLDPKAAERMKQAIMEAKARGDSVGGVIECKAVGLPVGLGAHMFGGVENRLSAALFGIPAVKGVEFGAGFAAADLCGSQNNDAYLSADGEVKTATNHHGGVLGGMTTGMPLVVRVAVKPTPSIAMPQQTLNLATGRVGELVIGGRHDPCIVPRAVPVVEAVTACVLLDLLLIGR